MDVLTIGRARRRIQQPAFARLVRTRAGLTQLEMAEYLGVDRSAVSRWEAGERLPRADVLKKYSELLDRLQGAEP